MDREKAIQILKRCEAESYCSHYKQHHCCIGCGQREALDLAIEALEREVEYGQMVVDFTKGEKVDDWVYDEVDRLESLPPVEPKTVCEDAISRADTLKALCAECNVLCEDGIDKESYCTEYALINDMPPVTPTEHKTTETMIVDGMEMEIDPVSYEVGYTHGQFSDRPKGKWKYGNGHGECPFCGRERQLGWDNFCGFCGADMRGDKE